MTTCQRLRSHSKLFDVGIKIPSPGVPGSAATSLPLRVPSQGLPCYIAAWFHQCVAKPPPSSSQDLFYWSLVCLLSENCIGEFLWPMDLENSPQTCVDKCLNLVLNGFGGPSSFCAIQQYRLDICVEKAQFGCSADLPGTPNVLELSLLYQF